MKLNFDHEGQSISVDLTPSGKSFRVDALGGTIEAQILQAKDGKLDLLIDGQRVTAYVLRSNKTLGNGQRPDPAIDKSSGRRSSSGHHHVAGELTAPMPLTIRAVNVSEGGHGNQRTNAAPAGSHEDGNPGTGAAGWRGEETVRPAGTNSGARAVASGDRRALIRTLNDKRRSDVREIL